MSYNQLKVTAKNFIKCRSGATAIEYGILIAVLGLGVIILSPVGESVSNFFDDAANKMGGE